MLHTSQPTDTISIAGFDAASEQVAQAAAEISRIIKGQSLVIEQTLCAMLAGGHVLLVGVPGVAKTRLVKTLGTVLGLDMRRVQFTPDLMPADILGAELLQASADGDRYFSFSPGPIFCNLLMADEINRASPRTQSALLEAMQEHQVTISGKARPTPEPFQVIATQNPIEQEGTYPLPEAQLDRFLMQVNIDYPDLDTEKNVVLDTTGDAPMEAVGVMTTGDLQRAQTIVRQMPVPEQVLDIAVRLVRAARPSAEQRDIRWGAGPRAAQALVQCAKARAFLNGLPTPILEDIKACAAPVLWHRLHLSYEAQGAGKTIDQLIHELVDRFF
jgi:MoxR-like ATPase